MDTPETMAAKLLSAAAGAVAEAQAVVSKGALNIKNGAKASVERTAPVHNAHAARTIGYETGVGREGVTAEIGYDLDKGKAANIAWLLEYGGGGDHSPPHRDVGRATDTEAPRFVQSISTIPSKLL